MLKIKDLKIFATLTLCKMLTLKKAKKNEPTESKSLPVECICG